MKIEFELPDDLDLFELCYEENRELFKIEIGKKTRKGVMIREWMLLPKNDFKSDQGEIAAAVSDMTQRMTNTIENIDGKKVKTLRNM